MCSTEAPSGIVTTTGAPGGPEGPPKSTRSTANSPTASTSRARAPAITSRRRRPRLTPPRAGPGRSATAPPPPGSRPLVERRRDVVGIRRAIDVVRRSSSVRIGMLHRLRSRAMNASVSTACGPRSPRSVSGRPTTTTSGASRSMIAHSSAMPLLAADLLDDAERPRERAARIADRDARARAAVVERERLRSRREQAARGVERLVQAARVLAARARHGRAPAASAAHDRARSP